MTLALQTLFSSLANGSLFVLMGAGIVLCYRSSRVVNLAHGESFAVAGLVIAKLVAAGLSLALAGVIGLVAAVALALFLERVILRPRLDWQPGRLIIVALGFAVLVEGVLNVAFGADARNFPAMLTGSPIRMQGAAISRQAVLAVGVAVVVPLALAAFFRWTTTGKAMTASAESPRATELLGVNTARLRQLSFGLAGAIGALSALLIVPATGISYNSGLAVTLNGFVAAAFANMTSVTRVLWGGLALGLIQGIVGAYWNPLYQVPVVLGGVLLAGVVLLSRGVRFGGVSRA
jgi:branched-subunit amino acid ABC-type transport system permease component